MNIPPHWREREREREREWPPHAPAALEMNATQSQHTFMRASAHKSPGRQAGPLVASGPGRLQLTVICGKIQIIVLDKGLFVRHSAG